MPLVVGGKDGVPNDTSGDGIGDEGAVFLAPLLPEIELGRPAYQLLRPLHVLDAGDLHHDPVVPDPLNYGLRHAERVDPGADYPYDAFDLGVGDGLAFSWPDFVDQVGAALYVQPLPEAFPVDARRLVRDQDHQGGNDQQADDYQPERVPLGEEPVEP